MGLEKYREKLRKRIQNWLEIKANPIAEMFVDPTITTQHQPYDFDSHLQVYLVNVYCFSAIKAIARDVAAIPLMVQELKTVNSEPTWVDVESGELYDLLEYPNSDDTKQQLIERMVSSLMATGNGYWIFDGLDKEFYYVNPAWVKVNTDKAGQLTGYEITNRGINYNAEIDELIHWKLTDIKGSYQGMPPSQVIKDSIKTKISLDNYIRGFFKNNALAGSTFSTDQELSEENKKSIRKELDKLLTGEENYFRTAILDKGAKLDKLSHNLKDLIPVELDDMIRQEVGAAYGVPPSKLGVFGDMTFSNAEIMDKVYSRDTIRPIGRLIASVLNLQFVKPRYDSTKIRVRWDEESVPGLTEDENEKSDRFGKLVEKGVLTPNEARVALGYEPVDGGDDLRGNASLDMFSSQIGQTGNNNDNNDNEDNNDDGESGKSKKPSLVSRTGKANPRHLVVHEKRLKSHENSFKRLLGKFFDEQLDRLLENLNKISSNGNVVSSLLYYEFKKASGDDNDVFNLSKENKALEKKLKPFLNGLVQDAGNDAVSDIAIDLAFNINNPEVITMIDSLTQRLLKINGTSQEVVSNILKEAYENGDTVNDIAKALRDKYKEMSRVRSETIARTETNGAVNGGKFHAYKQGGVTKKQWVSAQDGDVRDIHAIADGEIVDAGQAFIRTGEPMMFPGDPSGSAANTVNCRCTFIGIVE